MGGIAIVDDDRIVLEDLGVSLLVGTPGCGGSVLGRTDAEAVVLVDVIGGAVVGTTFVSVNKRYVAYNIMLNNNHIF